MPRQLIVDDGWGTVAADEQVGLLGEVIVANTCAMQPTQEVRRRGEPRRVAGPGDVQGCAINIAALEPVAIEVEQGRYAVDAVERSQRARLAQ